MLMDHARTSAYCNAIQNSPYCNGRSVLDLGAGSGILSYFAVNAGAKIVYAVEASTMAVRIKKLVAATPKFREKIIVLQDKVENLSIEVPIKVDTIISEPIGVLLVHERMVFMTFIHSLNLIWLLVTNF